MIKKKNRGNSFIKSQLSSRHETRESGQCEVHTKRFHVRSIHAGIDMYEVELIVLYIYWYTVVIRVLGT